jgi:hypothetical protein
MAGIRAGTLALLATLLAVAAAAGEADLGTDRDAFTPAADTVGAGQGLVEGSYVFMDNLTGVPTNNYPELLVRIGACDRFEWRLGGQLRCRLTGQRGHERRSGRGLGRRRSRL